MAITDMVSRQTVSRDSRLLTFTVQYSFLIILSDVIIKPIEVAISICFTQKLF